MGRRKGLKNRVCPLCSRTYNNYPAISRRDNKTEICSDCGTKEAFCDYVSSIRK